MASENIIIKKLETADLDQVSRFRMANEEDKPLQIFIRKDARKSAVANLTQTYVAKIEGDRHVIGYVSIMCAEVALEKTYPIADKVGADRYDYQPAVRISRLAMSQGYAGKKIGRQLVETAIGIVLLSIVPHAGCRFMILDAKPKSIPFYKKIGFRLLDTEGNLEKPTPLMFLDLRNLIDGVGGDA
ncbi:MAG: GNAT family N-acetyltransferase [Sphingopyxis sp.]|nr:GNAT family N-acetyltransferase [Sphingopyxis sp.]